MDNRTLLAKERHMGKVYKTTTCGDCVVVDYIASKEVIVKFFEPEYTVSCGIGNLNKGNVNNPLFRSFLGVGFLGVGEYKFTDFGLGGLWRSMLLRCYNEKCLSKRDTYKDVTVCKEWHNFQNFAEWCVNQKGFKSVDKGGRQFQLDKDLLVEGNKIYSPETCCFVPTEINCFFSTGVGDKGNMLRGFRRVGSGKYQVRCSTKYIGTYDTEDQARQAYIRDKYTRLKDLLSVYKHTLNESLLEKLSNITISELEEKLT